ncbi:hypothetical protein BMJ34_15670 [Sinorhizobium medicae]|uniref:Ribbon-helix-helix protein CopG domain-containing protein n=1 Tax=Sinorhizobium medicae TaxID=110321 RepID=A0ABX4TLU2_9HYPH|nr:hypothetical protein [Sinorhizobium medicae]PLT98054.1 hypothetical protein BMJ34_15670 [Sinorhizobium medicae]PLU03783.1 hypothetical protein BMJ33_12820 [Sinorhizobium medicae]PLU17416.1 hypothetical protein BMJ29_20845 [Sinorhizobium medicae]PLU24123.1 hypothetical protein BMJ30_01715 [Sinorhizobium medicae]PLU31583.1 hypothetical protein BMJ27_21135 [Sinorhizobium medicae]
MARGELKTIKFQMMLSESEAMTLDAWAAEHGFKSRAEVIRRLCQLALLTDERANSVAKNLGIIDNLAVRFVKRMNSIRDAYDNSRVRMAEKQANLAEFYSEEFFDRVGDLAMDLDLILGMTEALRSNKSLDEVVEQLQKDRLRIQEASASLILARQNRREERKRLEGVDFLDLQKRMEGVIRRSPDLDLAEQAAHEEINRWLENAKANKKEMEKLDRERAAHLEERRKRRAEHLRDQDETDRDQGQT